MLGITEKNLSDLHPWEKNPRINDHAVDAVAKSIAAFGFNVPILCDHEMNIIAGHTRWKAARKLGLVTVPVIFIDMTEEQRQAFSIADNKTAEIADWDFPELRELLEELKGEDFDLQSLGFSTLDLRFLLGSDGVENDCPDPPRKSQIQPGDLFQLGNHRLICGDASNEKIMSRLLSD